MLHNATVNSNKGLIDTCSKHIPDRPLNTYNLVILDMECIDNAAMTTSMNFFRGV